MPGRCTRSSGSSQRSRTSSDARISRPCASCRSGRWPRTSARGGTWTCSTRSASRRSASASSPSSPPIRARSACCAVPGALRSDSGPRRTPFSSGSRASGLGEAETIQVAALRRLAIVLGAHFLEEESSDFLDAVRRVVVDRGSTYVLLGNSGREPLAGDPARLDARASRACAAGGRRSRRRGPLAPQGAR